MEKNEIRFKRLNIKSFPVGLIEKMKKVKESTGKSFTVQCKLAMIEWLDKLEKI